MFSHFAKLEKFDEMLVTLTSARSLYDELVKDKFKSIKEKQNLESQANDALIMLKKKMSEMRLLLPASDLKEIKKNIRLLEDLLRGHGPNLSDRTNILNYDEQPSIHESFNMEDTQQISDTQQFKTFVLKEQVSAKKNSTSIAKKTSNNNASMRFSTTANTQELLPDRKSVV